MASHFEINAEGFDDLMSDEPVNTASTASNESVVADTTIIDDTLLGSTNNDNKTSVEQTDDKQEVTPSNNDDVLTSFLGEYGLKDGKVTYENEDGTTEEVNFNELDTDEKLNILKATIQDAIAYYSQKAVDDYIKENGPLEKQYAIDDYSDDELYIADLKSKFSDMTDEDIKANLETAKENEELFKKKVDIIRKQYKAQEDEAEKEKEKAQEEQFNSFKTSLESQLNDFNSISMDYKDAKSDSLQIEDSEKDEIYKYILNRDENGATQFFKDLNNPKTLVELAWFALYGKEAISDITNYWKSQLKSTRRSENKTQTTVVHVDKNKSKDDFTNHHKFIETNYGENLL